MASEPALTSPMPSHWDASTDRSERHERAPTEGGKTSEGSASSSRQPVAQQLPQGTHDTVGGHNENIEYLDPQIRMRRPMNRVGNAIPANSERPIETVGQRIAFARLVRGLTQEAVAGKLRLATKSGANQGQPRPLSRTACCMYELGSAEPSLNMIENLARVLKVKPEWIAYGIGKPPRARKTSCRFCCAGKRAPDDSVTSQLPG